MFSVDVFPNIFWFRRSKEQEAARRLQMVEAQQSVQAQGQKHALAAQTHVVSFLLNQSI